MSSRSWKGTRRRLRGYQQEIDADKRARRRIPWYIWLGALLVEPGLRERWLANWEAEHRRKLRKAMKTTSHVARRIGR